MDATIHHDPFLPDSESGEPAEPAPVQEPVGHARDKKAVAAVRELIASKVDTYEARVRTYILDADAGEVPEPVDHTQDKNSIAAVKKLLDRKALAAHKKRMSDVAA